MRLWAAGWKTGVWRGNVTWKICHRGTEAQRGTGQMPFKSLCLGVSVAKITTQWQIAEFGVRSGNCSIEREFDHSEKSERTHVRCYDNFQRIGIGIGGELDGRQCFFERKAVRDERTHVEASGEDEAGDFDLQCEIGRVAADQIFFVQTD